MNSLARVRRARAVLIGTVATAAVLWAAAVAVNWIVLTGLADLVLPLGVITRRWLLAGAIGAAIAAPAVVIWRGHHARRLGRVALYLEERLPGLQFTLATAIEPGVRLTPEGTLALETAIAGVDWRGVLRAPVIRALAIPALALAIGLAAGSFLPAATLQRVLAPEAGDLLIRPAGRAGEAPIPNRLTPIVVRIEPPRYARRKAEVLEDPTSVAALAGSRIEVSGRGAAAGLIDSMSATIRAATAGDSAAQSVAMQTGDDVWSFPVVMPGEPAVMRLHDRSYDRILVLEPIPDAPPAVTLYLPRADTTLPAPKGKLEVDARFEDDIGLGRAQLEVHITTGGGERFETRDVIIARADPAGARDNRLRATIVLDTMNLGPGDVLHIRAVGYDQNDVAEKPGKGESETRTIRILDPRATYDANITAASVAAIDTSIYSQRMLIIAAEKLLKERPQLDPDAYIARSLSLSVKQGALRGRVNSIIFELENVEGVGFVGHTPVSLILRQAAEEMQGAERELSIIMVPEALVYMRKALALLEKIRDGNRYYPPGLLSTTPVEIERVRMTGKDQAEVDERDPRKRPDDPRQLLLERLDRAIALLDANEPAAGDSVQLIFAASLTTAKDVSEALGKAAEALQHGADPRPLLTSARRRLERRVESDGSLSTWFGTP